MMEQVQFIPDLIRNPELDVLQGNVEIALKQFDIESFKKYDFRLIDKTLPACRQEIVVQFKQFEFGVRVC